MQPLSQIPGYDTYYHIQSVGHFPSALYCILVEEGDVLQHVKSEGNCPGGKCPGYMSRGNVQIPICLPMKLIVIFLSISDVA